MQGLYIGIQGDLYRVTPGAVADIVQVFNVSNNTASDQYASAIKQRIEDGLLMPFNPAPENGPGEMLVTYMTRDDEGNAVNRSTIVEYRVHHGDAGIFSVWLGDESIGVLMNWPGQGWTVTGHCTDPNGDFTDIFPTRLAATEVLLGVWFDPETEEITDEDLAHLADIDPQ